MLWYCFWHSFGNTNLEFWQSFIYYSARADQRHCMQSYLAYTLRSGDHTEYTAESGVYISTTREYSAESGRCISWLQGVYCWVRGVYLAIHNYSIEKPNFFVFAMERPILSVLTRRATESHCQHYRAPILYTLPAQRPKGHTNFHGAIQCLFGVLNHAWLDRHYCFPAASHYECRQ